jgi:molecular chaperone HscC
MTIAGIDLGTTNSLIAVWQGNEAIIIPNAIGERLTPSVVGFDMSGELLVGQAAKERLITHPRQTAALFKRFMGATKTFSLGNRTFKPEELSSFILRALKEDAEAYLGDTLDEAVISVPAYFGAVISIDDELVDIRETLHP